MSAPAENARSPAPVTSSARDLSPPSASRLRLRSSSWPKLSAFRASGRSSVISAISSWWLRWIAIASSLLFSGGVGPAHRLRPDMARFRPFDELAFQDLAAGGQRIGCHRNEILRHVVARQPGLVEVPQQLVGAGARALVKDHRQAHLLAEPRVGHREGGAT